MDAQHFAKQRCRIQRVAARFDVSRAGVVGGAAVAGGDVKIAFITGARTEAAPPTVMIGLRLIEGEQRALARGIGNIGISRDRELRNVSDTGTE